MSIIQEALEKARSDMGPGPSPLPENAQMKKPENIAPSVWPSSRVPARPRISNKKALITAALIIFVLIALLLSGRFLSMIGDMAKRTSAKNSQEVSYRPIIRDIVKEPAGAVDRLNTSPKPVKNTTAPELVLNGIMYVEGKPRAIINNLIVEPGDRVLGAIVTGIKRESVILEHENVEITLNLR